MRRCTTALLLLLCVASCGGSEEVVPTAATLRAAGDAFAREGRWAEAAERYRLAYAQVDPLPDRAGARSELALLRGRALSRDGWGERALSWVSRALALDPSRYDLHYEIASLFDGVHPELVDAVLAAEGYRRFLAAWEAAGRPASFEGLATHATKRLDALR